MVLTWPFGEEAMPFGEPENTGEDVTQTKKMSDSVRVTKASGVNGVGNGQRGSDIVRTFWE